MREFYSWKRRVRGPEPGEGLFAAWDQACVASCSASLARRRAHMEPITHSRSFQTQISSCDARPFLLFYSPKSGFRSGHDGDSGSDYFRYTK